MLNSCSAAALSKTGRTSNQTPRRQRKPPDPICGTRPTTVSPSREIAAGIFDPGSIGELARISKVPADAARGTAAAASRTIERRAERGVIRTPPTHFQSRRVALPVESG
jgi:hypothetical protein